MHKNFKERAKGVSPVAKIINNKVKKPRKTKRKKINLPITLSGRQIFVLLTSIIVLSGVTLGLRYFFLNGRFFLVKGIAVNKDRSISFTEGKRKLEKLYLNSNIFDINLRQVQAMIKNEFPYLKKVEVRRVFPDRVEVDIVSRQAAAVLETAGGIVIDKEAVVLAVGGKMKDLIKIKGISFFLNVPSRGETVRNKMVAKALAIVVNLRQKIWRYREKVDYVDVSDKNNIIVSIDGVAVKMGTDDFVEKITELNRILRDPDIELSDIRYIDLRFEDPVISPK